MDEAGWNETAKGLLRAELKRRDLTYIDLAERLKVVGIEETPNSIAKKVNRGTFSAAFLLACMKAIGCSAVRLPSE
ncbi:DUF6471 domain-containing protein [Azospirillum sp.]|uniref:DUF6471 domain-containing protein n=1 Tax=Azospirillum sp. TaxID=34012 RepID=UPI002D6C01E6|nr:DUF6471 domain-containing protein [Azospirillum sp.]HYF89701.1 DUF6471 domain-containing protein [Azospirillum sp.]